MSVIARVSIFLALLLVALFLFAQFVRRTSMFFPARYPIGDWNDATLSVKPSDENFTTSDGVRLHAWLFRAHDVNAPMLVWMHGNAGNITERAPMAAELARRGVSVLLFDWRGYGKSDGSPTESSLYQDALAAYDFARTKASGDIALYGESLGGPYAAYVAAHHRVRCVVIENSFPSLTALGNRLYHPIPLGWFAPFAMTTTSWLNAAHTPVLVMHGKHDQVIPFALGRELFDGLTVKKEMFVSETAGHCEIPAVEGQRYYDEVVRFITQNHF
jgi:fermentation-respiration switch protein FrsA (DUF1100 family)